MLTPSHTPLSTNRIEGAILPARTNRATSRLNATAPVARSVAVVGGGFLGMVLALRLAQQGKSVTLFEAAPVLGGVAAPWQLGEITWDRHYHVILGSDSHLRRLLHELRLDAEVVWKSVGTGFYIDSQLYSISGAFDFLRFPPLRAVDKARLVATILRACSISNPSELQTIPVEDWLEKWSGAAVTQKLWVPLLRAKLGEAFRQTSAAFIWATINRLYGARRTGRKTELFGYVKGGYARIIESLERSLRMLGVQLRLNRAVRSISPDSSGKLSVEEQTANPNCFSDVVVTTAGPLAARMCRGLSASEKNRLASPKYQGIICPSLLLQKPLSRFYVTNIADSNVPFTALVEMSALVDPTYFGGRGLVYLPKYVPPDSPYFDLSDEQIREEFEPVLARMHPSFTRSQILQFQVSRVKYLFPIPTLNYAASLLQTRTSIRGLHIANSAQIVEGTHNVNETIRLAEKAAREILDGEQ